MSAPLRAVAVPRLAGGGSGAVRPPTPPVRVFSAPPRPDGGTVDAPSVPLAAPVAPSGPSGASVPAEPSLSPSAPLLTPRQFAALDLAADGLSADEIAARLGFSPWTVKPELERAGRALGARSRAGTVGAAYRLGVFSPRPPRELPRLPALEAREWEALVLFARGSTCAQAAERLGVSVDAATRMARRLVREFGAVGRANLVRVAVDWGVLTPGLELNRDTVVGALVCESGRPAVDGATRGLSRREVQVLELAASGASDLEIARALFLSANTVATHMRRIFAALNARDRTHAVAVAYDAGLVPSQASRLLAQARPLLADLASRPGLPSSRVRSLVADVDVLLARGGTQTEFETPGGSN